jgi:hypothetical protein
MSDEKSIVMSLSVKPQMQEDLKQAARVLGWPVSKLMRILIEKNLQNMVVNGEDVDPVRPGIISVLKVASEKTGLSAEQLLETLVEKYLPLLSHDSTEIPVILRIPSHLKSDINGLRVWLNQKINGITAYFEKTLEPHP